MLHLLRIEWLKLKNYNTFWILSILYIVSIFGANFIAYHIQESIYEAKQAKGMAEMVLGNRPYAFPAVWQTAANVSGFVLFIPGLIMIILITNEYSFKTHRQNIIDGLTRKQFIMTKITIGFIGALISTIVVFLTAMIFGFASSSSPIDFENFYYIPLFLFQSTSYIMAATLIAILLKRGGLAIGVYFLYSVVLENVGAIILNHYFNYIGRYLPLETTDVLIPFPNIQRISNKFIPTPNYTAVFIFAVFYLAAYLFISIRKFKTSDL
ncbi:MAG: ABC transporter permease [Chitinophagaceae bacterium]